MVTYIIAYSSELKTHRQFVAAGFNNNAQMALTIKLLFTAILLV